MASFRVGVAVALVATGATLVAALGARRLLDGREPGEPAVEFAGARATPPEPAAAESSVSGYGRFELQPIDEATARELFPRMAKRVVFDPDCYFRRPPGIELRFKWPEHPDGAWWRRTNAAGLREDDDARLSDGDLRILVTGDSHTDGVCNNDETFTNLLEARLAARFPERRVVALNTGLAGYSFYNYLGVLRKYVDEGPDVFVVAAYGGNDFLDAIVPHNWFRGSATPPNAPRYWDRIEAAEAVAGTFVAQALNQELFFQEHPDQVDVALEAALVTAAEIRRTCDERDVRLVYVYLPPAFEAPWEGLGERRRAAMDVLDLSEADVDVTRHLAERFLAGLERLGIDVIDMGPRFREAPGRHYWKRDLHIDLSGHALVADALEAWYLSGSTGRSEPEPRADGPFEERDELGRVVLRGSWSEGRRDGAWVRYYADGTKQSEGRFDHGARVGEWRWWYEGGSPKKAGSYAAGAPDGRWFEWYRDGSPRASGRWSAGEPDGPWRQWHPGGALASEGDYRRGEMTGTWTLYFEDGSLDSELEYVDGKLDGVAEKRFPSGHVAWRGTYAEGLRDGAWTFFWDGGLVKEEGAFRAGRREGTWVFRGRDGALDPELSGEYRRGRRLGPTTAPD